MRQLDQQSFIDHVDHVGSLVRPRLLLEAMQASETADFPPDRLREIQDRSIKEVVKWQDELGLRFITDGEFRRRSWQRGFMDAVGGFSMKPASYSFKNDDGVMNSAPGCYVYKKLTRKKGIATHEFEFLKEESKGTPKITMPSPTIFHFGLFSRCVEPSVYPDIDEYFEDLISIYQVELDALGKLGCKRVQFDEVALALMCDPEIRTIVAKEGEDPQRLLKRYIKINNAILAKRPKSMAIGMHLCRGNQAGLWAGAGGYQFIAESLFNELEVDDYLLEFDTERAGNFEPLRFLPKGKRAFIGVMSTKNPALESEDLLLRKMDNASRYVPVERLGICPQCGFASSISKWNKTQNPMTEKIEREKLARLIQVASRVWQ